MYYELVNDKIKLSTTKRMPTKIQMKTRRMPVDKSDKPRRNRIPHPSMSLRAMSNCRSRACATFTMLDTEPLILNAFSAHTFIYLARSRAKGAFYVLKTHVCTERSYELGDSSLDSILSCSGNPCAGASNQSSECMGQSMAIVRVNLSDLGIIQNSVCVFEWRRTVF